MNTTENDPAVAPLQSTTHILYGEPQMEAAGGDFARQLIKADKLAGAIIILSGELGAGKTTFCRGLLRACGHNGRVKSPTYTLLEDYQTPAGEICHLDLYRLNDPDELEFIGFRDLLENSTTLLIEWPERAPELAAISGVRIDIQHRDAESRTLTITIKDG